MKAQEEQNPTSELQQPHFIVPKTHAALVNDLPDLSSNKESPDDPYYSSLSSRDNYWIGWKRPQGVKAEKEPTRAKIDIENENNTIKYVLDSWTKRFADIRAASIDESNDRAKESTSQKQLECEIKEAAKIEALKYLFNKNDADSQTYHETLKNKRLRKLLEEKEEFDSKDLDEGAVDDEDDSLQTTQ